MKWIKGPNVLDVGCSGHVVRANSKYWLHDHIYKSFPYVAGLDVSEDNISQMRSLGYKNLYVADAESFSINEKFDTIIAGEILEHLSNPGLFLQQAKKHLNPDGRLIITTPFPFSLLNILYAWLKYPNTCQNAQHTHWFCVRTFRSLINRYGYTVHHFCLIKDYELDNSSRLYRILAHVMVYLGFLLPKPWVCNDMLFVLCHENSG